MSVSAIIVNYHSAALLPPLVDQLEACRLVGQVIVADNSGELAGEPPPGPGVEIVASSANCGFGAAVNRVLERTRGRWLLVLNPDLRLCEGAVEAMVSAAQAQGTPLVGPRFFWDDACRFRLPPATGTCLWLHTAWHVAERLPLDRELFSFYWCLRHERFWEAAEPFFEPFLSGACLLVERGWVFSGLKGRLFDERFFLYFEDTDLCARALQQGIRPLCVPGAKVVHYWDQSPSPGTPKQRFMAEAHARFLEKHGAKEACLPSIARHPEEPPENLGELIGPPTFAWDRVPEGTWFEIGVNSLLVPFAQASIQDAGFVFPEEIWTRLADGVYHARLRHSVAGILKRWTWKKSSKPAAAAS